MTDPHDPALSLEDLRLTVKSGAQRLKIVDGVSFAIRGGEFFALVGESGSGKTMIAKSVMRLLSDEMLEIEGRISVCGTDVAHAGERVLRQMRGAEMAMIFQEPMSSLNPLMTVGAQIAEAMRAHGRAEGVAERVVALLADVRFAHPDRVARQYPHELSGGMRQRAMVAIALANRPRLLIADEPTTALDVTIQKEIMEILYGLARAYDLAVLLISHDLALVQSYADRVCVLYGGVVMELGDTRAIIGHPRHPYTAALLDCVPRRRAGGARMFGIEGVVATVSQWPPGCRFAPRCAHAAADCRIGTIEVSASTDAPGHLLRCLHPLGAGSSV